MSRLTLGIGTISFGEYWIGESIVVVACDSMFGYSCRVILLCQRGANGIVLVARCWRGFKAGR